MVLFLNKCLAVLFVFAQLNSAHAAELNFTHPQVAYWNFNGAEDLVLMEENGTLRWFQGGEAPAEEVYAIADEACRPQTANNMYAQGMTLAWPYFAGIDKVCFADSGSKSIRLLAQIQAPENAYTAMFLGEDNDAAYFVVNGRTWASEGYLKLWAINKKTQSAELKDFFVNVPGFSGAMWRDKNNFYVTSAAEGLKNTLYKINVNTLLNYVPYAGHLDFSMTFNKVSLTPFDGLSMSVVGGGEWFLFFNEGYDSFYVKKDSSELLPTVIPSGCTPVGAPQGQWTMLCDQKNLRSMNVPF